MSKYGAGDLNERITFHVSQKVDDGIRAKNTFTEGDSTWAHVKWVSDGEKFRSNALQQSVTLRFIIRIRPVNDGWRIFYNGEMYGIRGSKPIDKQFMEITCGSVANVNPS